MEAICSSMTLKQAVTCTEDRGCHGDVLGLMAPVNLQHWWSMHGGASPQV